MWEVLVQFIRSALFTGLTYLQYWHVVNRIKCLQVCGLLWRKRLKPRAGGRYILLWKTYCQVDLIYEKYFLKDVIRNTSACMVMFQESHVASVHRDMVLTIIHLFSIFLSNMKQNKDDFFLTEARFGKADFLLFFFLPSRHVFFPQPVSPGCLHTAPFETAGCPRYWYCPLWNTEHNSEMKASF